MSDYNCAECKDIGVIYKKYWKQPKAAGVHPAIAAGAPAYRTIATLPCSSCEERARKMKGTSLFVLTRIQEGEIKEMRVIAGGEDVARHYKDAVKLVGLRPPGVGKVFFENAKTLQVGQSSAVGDFNKTEVSVRRLAVE